MKAGQLIFLLITVVILGSVITLMSRPDNAHSKITTCPHDVIQSVCAKCDRVVGEAEYRYDLDVYDEPVVEPNTTTDDYVLSAEDSADMAIDWKPETYSDITVTTDKRTVAISLLRIADCNDAEISRFVDFMQLVCTGDFLRFDPNVYEVLIDRLISPKLITSDSNE